MPFIIAVSGFKDSGKTTLCMRLLDHFKKEGLDAAFFKHGCEPILSDSSTDSGKAVARGVPALLWNDKGIRLEKAGEFSLEEIVAVFFPAVDIVVVEGAKNVSLPRVWVGGERPPEEIKGVLARYDPVGEKTSPEERLYGKGGEDLLASFLVGLWRRAEPTGVSLYEGHRRIPVKDFVADFLAGGVLGMVGTLKGCRLTEDGLSLFVRKKKALRKRDDVEQPSL